MLLAVAIGLFAWLGAAISHAGVSVGSMVEAGLNCLPLTVLFLGLGTLLYGARPRPAIVVTYGLLGAAFAWELFGALLKAPSWVLGLSPFHHVAPVPAEGFQALPALVMIGIGLVAAAAGAVLFHRRDLQG